MKSTQTTDQIIATAERSADVLLWSCSCLGIPTTLSLSDAMAEGYERALEGQYSGNAAAVYATAFALRIVEG